MHFVKINLILILLIISIFSGHVKSETIGNPPYKSIKIPPSAYGYHFDMEQDNEKTLYISYINGIKVFDGATWHNIETGVDSGIRKLYFDKDNKIYFGGAGIFGYVFKDDFGVYQFTNITPINHNNDFGDIWHITECNSTIVFIGLHDVFLFDEKLETVKSWKFEAKLGDAFCYDNKLIIQDREVGLVELKNDIWVDNSIELSNNKLIDKFEMIDDDTFFILSQSNDWRIIKNNQIEHLQPKEKLPVLDNYIASASLGNGQLVLGSSNGLLTFIDINNLQSQSFQLTNEWISKIINSDDGLIILTEFEVFYLQWPSAIRIQGKDSGLASSLFDVKYWNKQFYVAGSSGVFLEDKQRLASQQKLYRRLDWTNKEAWYILPINDKHTLLAESHKLLLIEDDNNETKIETLSGIIYPRILIQSKFNSNLIYVVTEFDLQLLMRVDGDWKLKPMFKQRPNSLIEDKPGSILMTINGGGFYQMTIDLEQGDVIDNQDVSKKYQFESANNEDTSLILTVNNKLNAYNSHGIFKLNSGQAPKYLFLELSTLLEGEEIRKIIQGDDGLYYGFTPFKFFYQDTKKNWQVIDMGQYLQGIIDDIKIINNEIKILSSGVLITYDKNYDIEQTKSEFLLRLTKVLLKRKSIDELLPLHPENLIEFDQKDMTLSFSSVLNDIQNHSTIQYRFKLKGESDEWSDFTSISNIHISNLTAGDYTLNIEAKDINHKRYSMPGYHFTINPPWYLSGLAKIIWTLISILVLGLIFRLMLKWRENIHESQKRELKQIINSRTLELKKANANLQKIAHLDGLTGLSNRFHLDEFINKITQNEVGNVIVMMMDMDDFKQYNDTNGHMAGDVLLKKMAHYLSEVIDRPSDIVARYGGEEFLVILVDCDLDYACSKAEKIRQYIENKANKTSVSIGICQSFNQSDLKRLDAIYRLIDKADQALYEAKEAGRNRVVICD